MNLSYTRLMKFAASCLLLFFATISTAGISAAQLSSAAQNSTPKYFEKNTAQLRFISGVGIDILTALEEVDPSLTFSRPSAFTPLKRIVNNLTTGQVDVFVGLAYSEKRSKHFRYVKTPIYQLKRVVVVRINDDVKITGFSDIQKLGKSGAISSLFGSRSQGALEKQGDLFINKKNYSLEQGLESLIDNDLRFFFYHDLGLNYLVKSPRYNQQLKVLPTNFGDYFHYMVVSNKVPLAVFNKIELAMEKLKTSGRLLEIYQNTHVTD